MSLLNFFNSKFNENTIKTFSNVYSLVFNQLLRYTINFFLSVWIIRYLGPYDFGAFNYVQALAGVFSVISSLGLQMVLLKLIISKKKSNKKYIGTSFYLSLIAGVFSYFALIVSIYLINSADKLLLYLALINGLTFIFDSFKIFTYTFEANVNSAPVAKISNISLIIVSICKIVVIYFNLGLFYLSFCFVLDYIITGILFALLFSKYHFNLSELKFKMIYAKYLLNRSMPFVLSSLLILTYMKVDQILIKNLLDNKQLGIFSASIRLVEIFYFIPMVIQSTLFPSIFKEIKNPKLFQEKLYNLYSIFIIISYIIIFSITLLSGFVIRHLYGLQYIDAKKPLLIFAWTFLFMSLGVARNIFIYSKGLNKINIYISLVGLFSNLILNYILIPKFGISGSAAASLISQFLTSYISSIFFKELHENFKIATKALYMPKVNFKYF